MHAYRDGRAPGLARVRALGLEPVVFPAAGTSEDVALLLADDKGAELIVVVGIHNGPTGCSLPTTRTASSSPPDAVYFGS